MSSRLKCPFCSDARTLPFKSKDIREHLLITLDRKSRIHVHGPTKNKKLMKSFILSIAKEAGIDFKEQGSEVKQGEAQEFEEESSRQGIEEDAKDSSTSRDGPGSENRDNQN